MHVILNRRVHVIFYVSAEQINESVSDTSLNVTHRSTPLTLIIDLTRDPQPRQLSLEGCTSYLNFCFYLDFVASLREARVSGQPKIVK